MIIDVEALRSQLTRFGQQHLLNFWPQLSPDQQRQLYEEISKLDVAGVTSAFEKCVADLDGAIQKLDHQMQPLPAEICGSIMTAADDEKEHYRMLAYEHIVQGKLAILLLAGGQGTRLGVSYPKGMYKVGLPSGKSLFQLQAERIVKLQQLAEKATGKSCANGIMWYIMTSDGTIKPTMDFFREHNFFGLHPDNVFMFQQGTLPCFDFQGKILMQSKYSLARAPDGNGGLYRALRQDGVLDHMVQRGVTSVQLYCVDNILVRVGDPLFTGYCLSRGAECGNKVVAKGYPAESVGITCKVDGKFQVVEYSEILPEVAERREPDGSLTFSAANICVHFFTTDFLRKVMSDDDFHLAYHVAKKKIPFIDPVSGQMVSPQKPNGIKMEKYVFDVFQFAREEHFAIWECIREDEFAPLKNADSSDPATDFTPSYCRDSLFTLHHKFILEAGGKIVDRSGQPVPKPFSPAAQNDNNNNNNNCTDQKQSGYKNPVVICEVSPLVSYAGEGLEGIVQMQSPFRDPVTIN